MASNNHKNNRDIILVVLLLIACTVVFKGTLALPKTTYEPLGPAFLPRALSVCVGILALVILAQNLKSRFRHTATSTSSLPQDFSSEAQGKRSLLAIGSVALTIIYIFSMQSGLLGFRLATILYMLTIGGMLTKMKLKMMVVFMILACIMGIGGHYVFTKIFVVDLP